MRRHCRICSEEFEVAREDLQQIEKISPVIHGSVLTIAPPTLCPGHRAQRRQAWRNERTLYRRVCDATGKPVISIYHPDSPFPVYAHSHWWSDRWDAAAYGRELNFEKPFFEQYRALQAAVPRIASFAKNAENSDYCNHVDGAKDCYICTSVAGERLFYSDWIIASRDVCDSYQVRDSELCYENIYCRKNYRCSFCYFSDSCSDSAFLYHCKDCHECYQCWNLQHARYCIGNKQCTKQEYEAAMLVLRSSSRLQKERAAYDALIEANAVRRDQEHINCEDCSGDLLRECKNVRDSYEVIESRDARYCSNAGHLTDCLDILESGFSCSLQYESHACNRSTAVFAGHVSYDVSNVCYVDSCHNSSNLFGCIGLRNARYSILNKEYSKSEYENIVPRLIRHMEKTGEWGEFFPAELSPFGYNESIAYDSEPLSQEEVFARGWRWREADAPGAPPAGPEKSVPDSIDMVSDEILDAVITCEHTKRPFKLVGSELELYRKLELPIPRLHFSERRRLRMARRNQRKLWRRNCARCRRGIETSYAPAQRETVVCEECYQSEVF